MIDFQTVKSKVSVRDYAESVGFNVSGSGMIHCPFHDDRTPSMKVDDRYYCFGCGAKGDVIDFVAELNGISKSAAAKRIAEEFEIDSGESSSSVIPPRVKKEVSLREWRNAAEANYIQLEKDMKLCIEQLKPAEGDDSLNPLFAYAINNIGYVGYLIDCLEDCRTDEEIEKMKGMIRKNE